MRAKVIALGGRGGPTLSRSLTSHRSRAIRRGGIHPLQFEAEGEKDTVNSETLYIEARVGTVLLVSDRVSANGTELGHLAAFTEQLENDYGFGIVVAASPRATTIAGGDEVQIEMSDEYQRAREEYRQI